MVVFVVRRLGVGGVKRGGAAVVGLGEAIQNTLHWLGEVAEMAGGTPEMEVAGIDMCVRFVTLAARGPGWRNLVRVSLIFG